MGEGGSKLKEWTKQNMQWNDNYAWQCEALEDKHNQANIDFGQYDDSV
jgi:hypothetical protein